MGGIAHQRVENGGQHRVARITGRKTVVGEATPGVHHLERLVDDTTRCGTTNKREIGYGGKLTRNQGAKNMFYSCTRNNDNARGVS